MYHLKLEFVCLCNDRFGRLCSDGGSLVDDGKERKDGC